jgi:hypothetical protein
MYEQLRFALNPGAGKKESTGNSKETIMIRISAGTAWVFVLAVHAGAADTPSSVERIAFNDLAQQFSVCSAFWSFKNNCYRDQDPRLAQQGLDTSVRFYKLAVKAGMMIGIRPRATSARVKLAEEGMQEQTDHDCRNIAIVLVRYTESCRALLADPVTIYNRAISEATNQQKLTDPAQNLRPATKDSSRLNTN